MVEPLFDLFSVPTSKPHVLITDSTDVGAKNRTIVYSTVLPSIFLFTLLVVTRHIIRKRRRKNRDLSMVTTSSVYSIPDLSSAFSQTSYDERNIQRNTHLHNDFQNKRSDSKGKTKFPREPIYKNQENPVYLVPFTALPKDFDFSSRNIQVCSDFVIVKDLDILKNCKLEASDTQYHEEYHKQPPFNPTLSRNHLMVY